jgi:hypothetical protein
MRHSFTIGAWRDTTMKSHTESIDHESVHRMRLLTSQNLLSFSIAAAADLGIADMLAEEPLSALTLAQRTQTDPDSLARLLRVLVGNDILATDDNGTYTLTRLGTVLRSDVAGSIREWARMIGRPWFYHACGDLLNCVRTGQTFFHRQGTHLLTHFANHPDDNQQFYDAMIGWSGAIHPSVAEAYDASPFGTLIDVGGGNGSLIIALLQQFSHLHATLYDLPAAMPGAQENFARHGLTERTTCIAGDARVAVPEGGDLYTFSFVLNDYPDQDCVTMLRNCRQAIGERRQVRLALISLVVPDHPQESLGWLTDMMMLALTGGRNRTLAEYTTLLNTSGFALQRIIPTPHASILEAKPVI